MIDHPIIVVENHVLVANGAAIFGVDEYKHGSFPLWSLDCEASAGAGPFLFQADHMEAHRILFGIGLLTDEPKNLFGVCAHCSPARRWYLFRKLDNPIGSRD
jgi:hypothetical protein